MLLSELEFRPHSSSSATIFWDVYRVHIRGVSFEIYRSRGNGGGWGATSRAVPEGMYGICCGVHNYGPLTEIEAQAVLFELTKAPADA